MKMGKRFTASLALVLAMFMAFTDVASAFDGVDVSASDEVYEESFESFEENSKLALGSDGVQYDAAYISEEAFARLNPDAQDAYKVFCDDIAAYCEMGGTDMALGCDKEGAVYIGMTMSENALSSFMDDIFDSFDVSAAERFISDVSEGEFADISGNDDISSNDVTVEEETTDVSDNDETDDVSSSDVESMEIVSEETNPEGGFIAENMEFFENFGEPCEVDEEIALMAEDYDTLISWYKSSYFTSQLSSYAMQFYNGTKSAFASGKTSFSINTPSYKSDEVWSGVAMALLCFPYQTSWNNGSYSLSGRYYYASRQYTITISTKKSSYYSKDLQEKAAEKVKTIVNNALNQSGVTDPTYSIVAYCDSWLCSNNYYEKKGVNGQYSYPETYYYCHSPYGTLLKGYGVCESYAKALTWMLDTAGITNMYVVSKDHAFVYVEMPDKKWYMVDSTWNDTGSSSTKEYLLCGSNRVEADDESHRESHKPTGQTLNGVKKKVSFPKLNSEKYKKDTANAITLSKTVWTTTKGKSLTLKIKESYYSKFTKTWSTSNPNVADVNTKGKVVAKGVGTATISCKVGGKTLSCNVYVHDLSNITFNDTDGKTKFTKVFPNTNPSKVSGSTTIKLTINQKSSGGPTAQTLANVNSSSFKLSVKSSNKKVADVTGYSLTNNTVTLTIAPYKYGDTKITVKFGGKTATLTYQVREKLQDGWFNGLTTEQKTVTYSGKAYTPKITKNTANTSLPKKLTYKVSYTNNKNAGTATVTVKGTGNYTGEVTRTFTIKPYKVTQDILKYSVPTNKPYTGKNMLPKVTVKVKVGKSWKTLKKDTDYTLSLTSAINAGNYNENLTFKGNYTGGSFPGSYTITKVPFKKLSASAPSSMKYKGTNLISTINGKIKVKYGKNVLPASDYTISYQVKKDGKFVSTSTVTEKGTYKVIITMKGNNVEPSREKTGAAKPMEITKTFKVVK